MERAFRLLYSAGCWSDQPYDSITQNILVQIAIITPKANFYPPNFHYMMTIHWNGSSLPYSIQHFGYYLIVKKMIETSEEWNFMHPSSATTDMKTRTLLESKEYDEKLLAKLYWDYRDSYNPTARLSAQMEEEIRSLSSTQSYRPTWEIFRMHSTNYRSSSLTDLYSNGDVILKDSRELKCFPLSQWIKDEYKLQNVWIGLFKFIEEIKKLQGDIKEREIER
ncbi:unnamed protein product, partial [Adineta ricciae]